MQFDIRRLDITASTNDDVKKAAQNGASEGLVVWALQQSAGRGRQGRQWQSPAGNLYFSVLLRPACDISEYGCYSFIAALAIGEAVRALLPDAAIELKWPNDVLIGGKKISGILLEGDEEWLVIGMGVNVCHLPDNPLYPVTSLAAENAGDLALAPLLNKILASLGRWHQVMNEAGFAPIRAAWLTQARKGAMRVRLPKEEIYGHFIDLDLNGNLRLMMEDKSERVINSGDVFF